MQTKENWDIIIEKYLLGEHMNSLTKEFKVSPNTFKNKLKLLGIIPRTRIETLNLIRNYNCFENINTEEKAYWLGFIAADGCIDFKSEKRLSFSLKESDFEHLQKFATFLKSPIEIKSYVVTANEKLFNICQLTVISYKLCQDLIKLGCTPRKSLTLNIKLDQINIEFHKDFWRGYFDGDGCIGVNSKESYSAILGTKEMLDKFLNFIKINDIQTKVVPRYKHKTKNNTFVIGFRRIKNKKIMDLLYSNSTVFLNRKKAIYEKIH